jgi:hypothetical protein
MKNLKKINSFDLIRILKMTQEEVKTYMNLELRAMGYKTVMGDGFLYAEGDIPVGLVAHMDTVHATPKHIKYHKGTMTCDTGLGADDRAGVYGILHLVRSGYRPSIFLMEDEEIGMVGAGKFQSTGIQCDVNYLIELDRQGSDDAVYYDDYNTTFMSYVESFGFKEQFGSYSDISILAPFLGVSAVNLSVGYYRQHTKSEYLVVSQLLNTLSKVSKMLDKPTVTKFKYSPMSYASGGYKAVKASGKTNWTWVEEESKKAMQDYSRWGSYYADEKSWGFDADVDDSGNWLKIKFGFILTEDNIIEVENSSQWYYINEFNTIYDEQYQVVNGTLVDESYNPIQYYDFL